LIYVDTSVVLAELLAENRAPPAALWQRPLGSSRLLECELWTQVHARKLAASHGRRARELLAEVTFFDLDQATLARALEPFPVYVRTLDALHLASIEFLRGQGRTIELATYDKRMLAAADAMRIPVLSL
jgi:predicted nucleic acid-binding protein